MSSAAGRVKPLCYRQAFLVTRNGDHNGDQPFAVWSLA